MREWWCAGIAMWGSGGAWELGAWEVGLHRSGGAWEWRFMGVAVHGISGVGSWCMGLAVHRNVVQVFFITTSYLD